MKRVGRFGAAVVLAFSSWACGGGSNDSPGGGGNAGTGNGGGGGGGGNVGGGGSGNTGGTTGSCNQDPLKTGLVAQQTGVSVDAFDCEISKYTAQYNEPDAMLFKAIIYVESRFDKTSVACPNLPCGTPAGWTADESGCFGLMQVVPACGGTPNDIGLLSNGHPNLTTDESSSDWTGSIFNPEINVQIGISGIAGNRAQVEQEFSGCSVEQYTLMAIGNYNSYGSTKSCTEYNTDYDSIVLEAYQEYAAAAGYTPHPYP